jgi:hypothetical protein
MLPMDIGTCSMFMSDGLVSHSSLLSHSLPRVDIVILGWLILVQRGPI